jgi:hypothetical protein
MNEKSLFHAALFTSVLTVQLVELVQFTFSSVPPVSIGVAKVKHLALLVTPEDRVTT